MTSAHLGGILGHMALQDPTPQPPSGGTNLGTTGTNSDPFAGFNWRNYLSQYNRDSTADARTSLWGAQQRYGVGQQGIGNNRDTLNRQLPLLQGLYGNQKARFGLGEQDIGLRENLLGIGDSRARYDEQRGQQELGGQSAALGAITTPGHGRRQGDLRRELADELAKSAVDRQRLGLERQGIKLDRKDASLKYKEARADIKDGLKALDLRSKELGIGLGEAKRRMGDAIQKSGLAGVMSLDQLLGGWAGLSKDAQDQVLGLLNQ